MTTHEKLSVAREHHKAGRFAEAEQFYREVLAAEPRNEPALRLMVFLAHHQGRSDAALHWLQMLVEVAPSDPAVRCNLATTQAMLGDTDAALLSYQRALALDPSHAGYRYNFATLLKDIGQLDASLEEYRASIRLAPANSALAWSNLLYLIHFHPDYDRPRIYREHAQWAAQNAAALEFAVEPHGNDRSPDRKLRIGYVFPMLREHATAFFLLPLIENHDRERFEITFYTDLTQSDDITQRYRAAADHWRETAQLSDEQIAGLVRQDRIDILVDLNLHMGNNRLGVFARKPAPVQATWLGYPSTTGLKQIDWRLTDAHLDPDKADDRFYFEKSFRLPWNFCYRPIRKTPAVNALPAKGAGAGGRITFGCLNNPAKVTPPTLDLWSKVLAAVPQSRLIALAGGTAHRRSLLERFTRDGIDAERLEFVGHLPQWDYFATYHRIDIALDTFPYPGHTTTCDALWMGVPVVTLPGATASSRGGVSILNAAGLPALIATSVDDCVRRIVELAADVEELAQHRQSLRACMESSPLMAAPRFARDFEAAYREMWVQWVDAGGR